MHSEGRFVFSLPVGDEKIAVQVNIFRLVEDRYIANWKCLCLATDRTEATTISDSIEFARNRFEAHCAAAHS